MRMPAVVSAAPKRAWAKPSTTRRSTSSPMRPRSCTLPSGVRLAVNRAGPSASSTEVASGGGGSTAWTAKTGGSDSSSAPISESKSAGSVP